MLPLCSPYAHQRKINKKSKARDRLYTREFLPLNRRGAKGFPFKTQSQVRFYEPKLKSYRALSGLAQRCNELNQVKLGLIHYSVSDNNISSPDQRF